MKENERTKISKDRVATSSGRKSKEREAMLAERMRENLKRRKQQKRARSTTGEDG